MRRLSVEAITLTLLLGLPVIANAATTCNTVGACIFGQNTSSGIGVEGVSLGHGVEGHSSTSFGVVGFTTYNSTNASNGKAGVEGEDSSSNHSRYNAGVYGESPYGQGVYGHSTQNYGIQGESTAVNYLQGAGIGAFSEHGAALFAQSGTLGIVALETATGNGGEALFASSYANASSSAIVAVSVNSARLFVGSDGKSDVASIDRSGNMVLKGALVQNGSPLSVHATERGQRIATYGAQSSAPSIEDFGRAQLRRGAAFVELDSRYASLINRKSYMVFLTAEGASKGIYVLPGLGGFQVRENGDGQSSLSFSYRIVGQPAVETASNRLPLEQTVPHFESATRNDIVPREYPKQLR